MCNRVKGNGLVSAFQNRRWADGRPVHEGLLEGLFCEIASSSLRQPAHKGWPRVRRLAIVVTTVLLVGSAFSQTTAPSSVALRAEMEQIARAGRGRVGAAAMVVETGERVAFHGDEHFPMQSVYKFPIGMATLSDVDRGRLKLDQQVHVGKSDLVPPGMSSVVRDQHPEGADLSVRELLRFMIVESDGTASDVLLRLCGGPARVTQYLRDLGVNGVVVATSEKEMARAREVQYRNWSTPNSMLGLLATFERGRGLSTSSRALLLGWMTETDTGPRRIKGLLPGGAIVAHKTGSSGTVNGLTAATNDAGLITLPDGRHLAVAVFVSDSRADTPAREDVIARISRAAWDWACGSQRVT